jgi:hypothetical protein
LAVDELQGQDVERQEVDHRLSHGKQCNTADERQQQLLEPELPNEACKHERRV